MPISPATIAQAIAPATAIARLPVRTSPVLDVAMRYRDGALSSWRQALTELGDLRVRQRAEIESLLAEEPS